MNLIAITSALLRTAALVWVVMQLWRHRAWRLSPVPILLAVSLAPAVMTLAGGTPWGPDGISAVGAIAELAVSGALLAVVYVVVLTLRRHREAHRESQVLEHVFEHSPNAMALMDREDRVLRGNAEFVRMFGYSADETRGRAVADLIVPSDRHSNGALLKAALEAGATVSKESVRQRKDGMQIPVSITRTPIQLNGSEIAALGIYRDISERKSTERALRKSEERSHTILDHIDDGYYELDPSGKLVALNHALCKILGHAPEELLGMDGRKYLDAENAGKLNELFEWIGRGGAPSGAVDWEIIRRDGSRRCVEGSVSPIRNADGSLEGFRGILRDVTERRAADEVMRRQWVAIEASMDGMAIVDHEGRVEYANDAIVAIYGYASAASVLGQSWKRFYAGDELTRLEEEILPIVQEVGQWRGETYGTRLDGTTFPQEISLTRLEDGGLTIVVRDITERRRSEKALRDSQERYALAARGANDGLWDWNLRNGEIYFSSRWKAMLGYADDELSATPDEWLSRVHPDDIEIFQAKISAHVGGASGHFESEHRLRHKDGRYRWMLCRGSALKDSTGSVYRIAGSLSDITDRKHFEERLHHDAFHDALTGLPNRALLIDRLSHALNRVNRRGDYLFAVLFLDLDRFKIINDSLGHALGDQLLIAIARRLQECVRPDDTVARIGGDEFVVLLNGVRDVEEATTIADRIHESLTDPVRLGEHEVVTSASIGIAASSRKYERPEQILRDADLAMYRAKTRGKSRHEVFDGDMHHHMLVRLELENDLRNALQRNQLSVFYQPIVSLSDGAVVAFEALVRWNHPERGMISPDIFVPIAEETGIVVSIGYWILEEACRQMAEWIPALPADRLVSVHVNLSGRQFRQPDLVDQVRTIMARTGIEPKRLGLEITESVVMENAASAAERLEQLRSLDIQLQIDDFGTGYSSLRYLHRFPIDTLKIDRSFVRTMLSDDQNVEIVRSIVALAHELGLRVIAEGVETTEHLAKLRELGCEQAQGYFFCEAVPPDSPNLFELNVPTSQAV
jgi:diguanylate cyclase (GGDEF)-like protein/PAS domain S-box-containing protein